MASERGMDMSKRLDEISDNLDIEASRQLWYNGDVVDLLAVAQEVWLRAEENPCVLCGRRNDESHREECPMAEFED